jgi:pre-mRNA-splicing helicase BRR2
MRFISSQLENKIRIVALASSIANYKEVAEWVGAQPVTTFNFHPNARPIPLEIHMQGFDMPHFGTRMMAMSRPTLYAVANQARGKPTIIFVPNRKQARSTAKVGVARFWELRDFRI